MKLLLDEMYPPAIAEGLRARGHDAAAVAERPELRGLSDPSLFAAAQTEGRAVVTENVRDFVPLADDHESRGAAHHGLVFVHPAKHPRGDPRTIGVMVTALDALAARFAAGGPTSLRVWL